jgi:hypothetical protein
VELIDNHYSSENRLGAPDGGGGLEAAGAGGPPVQGFSLFGATTITAMIDSHENTPEPRAARNSGPYEVTFIV